MQQAGRRRNETQANDKLGDERGGGRLGGERGVYRVLFLEDICLCDSVNQFKV